MTFVLPQRPPQSRRRVVVRLWLPLTPILALGAPLATPLLAILWAKACGRGSPRKALLALARLLRSLSGLRIEVDTPAASVRLLIL